MNIGVLTGYGECIILRVSNEKKLREPDGELAIEEFVCDELGLSANDFNWQVLELEADGMVKFRMVEV